MFRPHPILKVEMPPWLYAKTHRVLGLTGLIVYRSTAMRETDSSYAVVRDLLDSVEYSEVQRISHETKDMMFGAAEFVLYALDELDDRVHDWTEEMREEARRFLEL